MSDSAVRAVTFDCWNTLIFEGSWEIAHGLRVDALEEAVREAGVATSRERIERAFDAAWLRHMEMWNEGMASGATEIAHWALAEAGVRPNSPVLPLLVERFEEASHSGRVEALEGARQTLEALSTRGIRCALICDTGLTPGRVVRRHLARLGLLTHLEPTIFSDEWSLPKPHAEVFRAALSGLGVEPGEAVHVGDLKRTDVAGARAVGMHTVRIRARHDDPSAYPEADRVVDSHRQLRETLEVLGRPR